MSALPIFPKEEQFPRSLRHTICGLDMIDMSLSPPNVQPQHRELHTGYDVAVHLLPNTRWLADISMAKAMYLQFPSVTSNVVIQHNVSFPPSGTTHNIKQIWYNHFRMQN